MGSNNPQFRCESDDIVDFSLQETASVSALLAYLLAVEQDHPGLIAWLVRSAALADNNWRLSAKSSNPHQSLIAQHEAIDWMRRRDIALEKAMKGAMRDAEDQSGRRRYPHL